MPQKINQYLNGLEGFRDRALSMHDAMKINPDSFQSFVNMEKEMIKEMNKGKNRKKKEKITSN